MTSNFPRSLSGRVVVLVGLVVLFSFPNECQAQAGAAPDPLEQVRLRRFAANRKATRQVAVATGKAILLRWYSPERSIMCLKLAREDTLSDPDISSRHQDNLKWYLDGVIYLLFRWQQGESEPLPPPPP